MYHRAQDWVHYSLSPPITLDSDSIKQVDTHKHLGIILTYNLDWSSQVHAVIMKANKILAVLRRTFYLQRKTLEMLYKVTVRSVIDFALPVYYHSLKLSDKNKLEQIQYKGAKLASGALHGTSMIKLNSELGLESIATRADFLSLNVFHKILIGNTRPLIKTCMPSLVHIHDHNIRKRNMFTSFNNASVKFKKKILLFRNSTNLCQTRAAQKLIMICLKRSLGNILFLNGTSF